MQSLVSIEQQSPRRPCDTSPRNNSYASLNTKTVAIYPVSETFTLLNNIPVFVPRTPGVQYYHTLKTTPLS